MTESKIRILTKDDAKVYRELRLQALNNNPEAFISTFEVERKKDLSSFVYELSAAKSEPIWGYYGVFIKEKLVGFCQISPGYAAKKSHLAYFYNLYIDPQYRKQGYARALMKRVLSELRDHDIELLFMTYLSGNGDVRSFYDKFGFQQCGVKPDAIKVNHHYEDELELFLKL